MFEGSGTGCKLAQFLRAGSGRYRGKLVELWGRHRGAGTGLVAQTRIAVAHRLVRGKADPLLALGGGGRRAFSGEDDADGSLGVLAVDISIDAVVVGRGWGVSSLVVVLLLSLKAAGPVVGTGAALGRGGRTDAARR